MREEEREYPMVEVVDPDQRGDEPQLVYVEPEDRSREEEEPQAT